MNAGKFTPGPWVVIPRSESSGKSVGTVEPKPETMERTNYWTVADVNILRPEWGANLHLIAAAPLMYEALHRIMPRPLADNPTHAELVEYWKREQSLGRGEAGDVLFALEALAAATGEA
jgi:hypothetical protein